jgi:hypothetical protein
MVSWLVVKNLSKEYMQFKGGTETAMQKMAKMVGPLSHQVLTASFFQAVASLGCHYSI